MMSRKRKVLIISDHFGREGGVEELIANFIESWRDRYDLSLLCFQHDEARVGFANYGLPTYWAQVHRRSRHEKFTPVGFFSSVSIYDLVNNNIKIKDFAFNTVLALKSSISAYAALFIPANSRYMWFHGPTPYAWFRDTREFRRCYGAMNRIICVSKQVEQNLLSASPFLENTCVLYNPIAARRILTKSKDTHDLSCVPPKTDKLRFVMVGRISQQKGYDRMLAATAKLNEQGLKGRYEVLCIGPLEEDDQDFSTQIKDSDVHILGFQENPYPILATADWFLSTSRYEGFSLSLQEAAVLGIPIMATDCFGVRELLGENPTCGIVLEHSVDDIARHMAEVIMNPQMHAEYEQLIQGPAKTINYDERLKAIQDLIESPTGGGYSAPLHFLCSDGFSTLKTLRSHFMATSSIV